MVTDYTEFQLTPSENYDPDVQIELFLSKTFFLKLNKHLTTKVHLAGPFF